MTLWMIKYRSANGLGSATVTATTQEEAEQFFNEHLAHNDLFGVIVRVTPNDPLAHQG